MRELSIPPFPPSIRVVIAAATVCGKGEQRGEISSRSTIRKKDFFGRVTQDAKLVGERKRKEGMVHISGIMRGGVRRRGEGMDAFA